MEIIKFFIDYCVCLLENKEKNDLEYFLYVQLKINRFD